MTSQHGRGRPPGRGGDQRPGALSYPKALLLAVVAVALGAYLLQLGHAPKGSPAASAPPPSSTTSTTAPPSTTTTTAGPSQAVKVLVANASSTNGVAAYYTSKLSAAGWGTLTATTAATRESASAVYYATGEQSAATLVAGELGLGASAVQALGAQTPVHGTTGAGVVVVVGNDLAAKATPGSGG